MALAQLLSDRSGELLGSEPRLLITISPTTSFDDLLERDMCAPFCRGTRSTTHSSSIENSFRLDGSPIPTTFSMPETPTRESDTSTVGVWLWTSGAGTKIDDIQASV